MSEHVGQVFTASHKGKMRYYARCSCGWLSPEAGSVEKLEKTLLKNHPKMFPKTPCPTPYKRKYPSEEKAMEDISNFWARRRGVRMPCRSYECVCGKWHTTSKPFKGYAERKEGSHVYVDAQL